MENMIDKDFVNVGSVVFPLFNKNFKTIKKEKIKHTSVDPLKVLSIRELRDNGHEEYGSTKTIYELKDSEGHIFLMNANHVSLKSKDTSSMLYYVGEHVLRAVASMFAVWVIIQCF